MRFKPSDLNARPLAGASIAPARRKAAATIAVEVAMRGITRRYGDVAAVDNLTMAVATGEIVCLLGPSGCGKSTLLRLIAGIEKPTSGRIDIAGLEVSGARHVPPDKRGVGLMFQDFALFPHLRIVDNVAFGLKRLGREAALREALVALDRVGLGEYAHHYPHALSGGQQQRVALARAIAPRPSVLLMDEPFSGLDGQLRQSVREDALSVLREARATAIIVTHDAEEAMRLSDRIAVMRGGRLVQDGKAKDLYHRPADLYVAQAFSHVNVIPCEARSGAAICALGAFPAPGVADGPAQLCLRPSDITIAGSGAGLPGRVIARRFLGNDILFEIGVEGLDAPLNVRRGSNGIDLGEEVGLTIAPESALVFDTNGARRLDT
ncbi:MAG: ABC transporter ATP-binding protein [Chitinophagales bacterium]|nr:ABC transporter ATP-binding protein [Hyphomicrobiales bacterium]